jgi:uncharacterized protein YjaG (DUF416 family)
MADSRDYSDLIVEKLALRGEEAFGSLDRLAQLYEELIPSEREKMALGLAEAIGSLRNAPEVMADAIHLAYHLELFTEAMDTSILSVVPERLLHESSVGKECANYAAYHPNRASLFVH